MSLSVHQGGQICSTKSIPICLRVDRFGWSQVSSLVTLPGWTELVGHRCPPWSPCQGGQNGVLTRMAKHRRAPVITSWNSVGSRENPIQTRVHQTAVRNLLEKILMPNKLSCHRQARLSENVESLILCLVFTKLLV